MVGPTSRAPGTGSASPPTISVVVASKRSGALLDACLSSLVPQCTRHDAEIVLAGPAHGSEIATLARTYPKLRVVGTPMDVGLPRLRGLGLAAARGRFVALTEDHCVADPQWLEHMMAHADGPADVVGGGMSNARQARAVDWGAYFSEYGLYDATRRASPPDMPAGPPLLTAANVAYARRVVPLVAEWMCHGAWENVVHARLAARGCTFAFDGAARVAQNATYDLATFCVDRYEHGREYARTRLAEWPSAGRWLRLGVVPLLPPVLAYRVARAAGACRKLTFVRALPATLTFFAAWSAGEAVGYLRGASR